MVATGRTPSAFVGRDCGPSCTAGPGMTLRVVPVEDRRACATSARSRCACTRRTVRADRPGVIARCARDGPQAGGGGVGPPGVLPCGYNLVAAGSVEVVAVPACTATPHSTPNSPSPPIVRRSPSSSTIRCDGRAVRVDRAATARPEARSDAVGRSPTDRWRSSPPGSRSKRGGFVDSAWNPAYYPSALRGQFGRRFRGGTWPVANSPTPTGRAVRSDADRARAAGDLYRPRSCPLRHPVGLLSGNAQRQLSPTCATTQISSPPERGGPHRQDLSYLLTGNLRCGWRGGHTGPRSSYRCPDILRFLMRVRCDLGLHNHPDAGHPVPVPSRAVLVIKGTRPW